MTPQWQVNVTVYSFFYAQIPDDQPGGLNRHQIILKVKTTQTFGIRCPRINLPTINIKYAQKLDAYSKKERINSRSQVTSSLLDKKEQQRQDSWKTFQMRRKMYLFGQNRITISPHYPKWIQQIYLRLQATEEKH